MQQGLSSPPGAADTVPEFLKLLAHDVRWQLLRALAHSDLRVQELSETVRRPLNLVSYHLKLLRGGELVHERRSSADARDIYYTLDLTRLGSLLRASGAALHPALAPQLSPAPTREEGPRPGFDALPLRVLFVCTHNRARSQMAEGILRHLGGSRVTASSAGVEPGPIHPLAVAALAPLGIDIAGQRPKHLDEFAGQVFDRVITVCDRAREQCLTFGGETTRIHWSIPDPIAAAGAVQSETERAALFARTAEELSTRIRFLLAGEPGPVLEPARGVGPAPGRL
jgi:protein-tyrosine-phosphatase/DNA-binding transcriptional ArsR family regulator